MYLLCYTWSCGILVPFLQQKPSCWAWWHCRTFLVQKDPFSFERPFVDYIFISFIHLILWNLYSSTSPVDAFRFLGACQERSDDILQQECPRLEMRSPRCRIFLCATCLNHIPHCRSSLTGGIGWKYADSDETSNVQRIVHYFVLNIACRWQRMIIL